MQLLSIYARIYFTCRAFRTEIRLKLGPCFSERLFFVFALWSSLQPTKKVVTIMLVCPDPEEIWEDILYVEGLQNENSTKIRSLLIRALVFCVHLVEQLTGDKKGHDEHHRMSIY